MKILTNKFKHSKTLTNTYKHSQTLTIFQKIHTNTHKNKRTYETIITITNLINNNKYC